MNTPLMLEGLKVKLEEVPRSRTFYLETYIENMTISEILKQPYSGEAFPGYEKINHEFVKLTLIFNNKNPDWKAALNRTGNSGDPLV